MKATGSAWRERLMEPLFLVPAAGTILLLIIWLALFSVTRAEHGSAVERHRAAAHNLVSTYEARVVRALRELELTLSLVDFSAETQEPRPLLARLESRDLLPPALFFTVSLLDETGRVLASTATDPAPDMASTPAVSAEMTSIPIAIHRARHDEEEERWWIDFSAPLDGNQGDGAARVVISADAEYLLSTNDSDRIGERGGLAIVNRDGIVLAARIGDRRLFDGEVPVRDWLVETGPGEVSEQVSAIDGERRYVAALPVFGWPLYLVAGLSVDEQMAPVTARAQRNFWLVAVVSIFVAILLVLLGRAGHELNRSRARLLEQQRAQAEKAEYLSLHDGLTGLPNRSLFLNLLGQQVRQSRRDRTGFAVLFLDLDHFKNVNDTLGHEAGDELLQVVSGRIGAILRDSDVLARLGGDEFVILVRDAASRTAREEVAARLLDAVDRPYELTAGIGEISVSIGLACYPDDGEDEQTLLRRADVAMYQAKQQGRNDFRFFGDIRSSRVD